MRAPFVALAAVVLLVAGCSQSSPTAPTAPASAASLSNGSAVQFEAQSRNEKACWGEATQVFAKMGEMGAHASQQSNPRLGLRNVARALYEAGIIPDDSLQALGAYLSAALGLSIDSCL